MSFALVAWAMEQEIDSATQKWVLVALANVANHHTGECRPKMETLARETSLGESTVRKAVGQLVKDEYVKRKRRRREDGSLGVYEFTFPEEARTRRPPLESSAGPPLGDSGHEPREDLEPGGVHPSPSAQEEPSAPRLTKIGGRDIAFDALALACGIEERSPRLSEVGLALNGGKRRGARPIVGIRDQFWREVTVTGSMDFMPSSDSWPESFEVGLAEAIRRRAEMYHRAMGGAILTPLALAKWWTDLPKMDAGGIQEFYDNAMKAVDNAERRHDAG